MVQGDVLYGTRSIHCGWIKSRGAPIIDVSRFADNQYQPIITTVSADFV